MNASHTQTRIIEVGEKVFEAEVLKAKQPVIVEFSATWSRPCHVLDSVLDQVATHCAAQVKFVRVDADNNPDLSLWFGIQSVPTLLYFLHGKVHARIVGTATKEAILAKLQTIPTDRDGDSPDSSGTERPGNSRA